MTLWQEQPTGDPGTEASMIDASFRINCKHLSIDHAHSLSTAINTAVPWLQDLPRAGVHPIHVAASQNGWVRPDGTAGADLIPSKRTRLTIRIDLKHAQDLIATLQGRTIVVGDSSITIAQAKLRPLKQAATIFSRYVYFNTLKTSNGDERVFVDAVVSWCRRHGFEPMKLLCGRNTIINTPSESLATRSVMLADVGPQHSLRLQEIGIGDRRSLGCGLVIPHKNTGSVQSIDD